MTLYLSVKHSPQIKAGAVFKRIIMGDLSQLTRRQPATDPTGGVKLELRRNPTEGVSTFGAHFHVGIGAHFLQLKAQHPRAQDHRHVRKAQPKVTASPPRCAPISRASMALVISSFGSRAWAGKEAQPRLAVM